MKGQEGPCLTCPLLGGSTGRAVHTGRSSLSCPCPGMHARPFRKRIVSITPELYYRRQVKVGSGHPTRFTESAPKQAQTGSRVLQKTLITHRCNLQGRKAGDCSVVCDVTFSSNHRARTAVSSGKAPLHGIGSFSGDFPVRGILPESILANTGLASVLRPHAHLLMDVGMSAGCHLLKPHNLAVS